MVSDVTVESFLDLLGQSDLVSDTRLLALTAEFLDAGKRPEDAQKLADELVKREVLTTWQADMLLQGKHRGFRLGPYRILRPLGQGGMSKVFLAEHEMMRRRSAIKVLPSKYQEDKDLLSRFHLEARAVAALDHPNIVRAYDFNKDVRYGREIHYLVMEYVEGSDLRRMVEEQGPLDCRKAADFVAQAAEGLAHAHAAGFVHRDIKPANLLVDPHGVLKILDLGLATLTLEAEQTLNPPEAGQTAVGTADYVAPEQVVDSRSVDGRADIYSLGLTFYFLLAGHRPFTKPTIMEVLMAHRSERPEPISRNRPDVPMDLESIVDKMAAKSPQQRYQTAKEVAEKLRKWLTEAGSARTYSRLSALMAEAARTKQSSAPPASSSPSSAAASELELAAVDDEPDHVEKPAGDKAAATAESAPAEAKSKPHLPVAKAIPRAQPLEPGKEEGKRERQQRASGGPPPGSETDLLAGLLGEELTSEAPAAEGLLELPQRRGAFFSWRMKNLGGAKRMLTSPWLWGGAVAAVVLILVLLLGFSSMRRTNGRETIPPPAPAPDIVSPPPSSPEPAPPVAEAVMPPVVPLPSEKTAPPPPPKKSEGTTAMDNPAVAPPATPEEKKPPTPIEPQVPEKAAPSEKPAEAEGSAPGAPVSADELFARIDKISFHWTQSVAPGTQSRLAQSVLTQAKGAARKAGLTIVKQDATVMKIDLAPVIAKGELQIVLAAELKCAGPGGKDVVVWKKSNVVRSGDLNKMKPAKVLPVLKMELGKFADEFFEQFPADMKRARAKVGVIDAPAKSE